MEGNKEGNSFRPGYTKTDLEGVKDHKHKLLTNIGIVGPVGSNLVTQFNYKGEIYKGCSLLH